jgi:hypothetical protein
MPPALERCVQQVMGKGKDQSSAYAICRTSMGLQADGSQDEEAGETMPDDEAIEKAMMKMAAIPERKDVSPESGVHDYGNVPFADPTNKKYPIDTEEHIRAAWNYINKPENAGKYPSGVAEIKARIVAAWKRVIDKAGPPSAVKAAEPLNTPTLLKKGVMVCKAVGDYVNGPQEGEITAARLKQLVANFAKYPRQVPVYLLTGKPNPEHPENLDERLADGWVDGLSFDGNRLLADLNLHGEAATAVLTDGVRGASIGTTPAADYDGTDIGEVLEHVVLTNRPFVKGMNIAASVARSGSRVACHFTAFTEEADMAEKKPEPAPKADEALNLTEKLTAAEVLLQEKDAVIRDLTAANANLLEEVKAFRNSPQLAMALKELDQQKRVNLANKVRFIAGRIAKDGQIEMEALRGWYDHDSDEVVLAGFKNSQFKGDLNLLQYHRDSVKKNPSRGFISGLPANEVGGTLTAEDKEQIRALGHDPELLDKTRGARNLTEYKRLKAAATKG